MNNYTLSVYHLVMSSDYESALESQLKIALDALAFYANPENYDQGESFAELSRISNTDLEHKLANRGYDTVGGKLARRALLEISNHEVRLRAKKIKKAAMWKKYDDGGIEYFSVRIEFLDSTKEWLQLYPAKVYGDKQAPLFESEQTSSASLGHKRPNES